MANKITFGLSNCVIFPILSTDSNGTPNYGAPLKMPGATELTLDPEGEVAKTYADNVVWFQTTPNNGYSGSLTLKAIPDAFYTEILGETLDANGVFVENADALPKEFALGCQFEGDEKAARRIFYRVTCSRPSQGSSTKEESIEPNDLVLNLTVAARLDNHQIKAKVFSTSPAYANFFANVYETATGSQTTEAFTGVEDQAAFQLAQTPTSIVAVYVNGALENNYTFEGDTITFETAPEAGAVITVTYIHA